MSFGGKYSSDQTRSPNLNGIDSFEFDLLEAFVNEGDDVELQVHPHALHNHSARDPGMQRHPMDIILVVRIELSCIEN